MTTKENSTPPHFLDDLQRRALVLQHTDWVALKAHFDAQPKTLYCGFDPTAESLHVGHLLPLITLRRFQQHGHRPIAVIGGATGLIGDPSGRTGERRLLTREIVEGWTTKISDQILPYLDFDCPNAALLVNNLDWTADIDLLSFLRDYGKHFSVNAMIQKESVKSRIQTRETGLSFTEFSYMLLQSLDYLRLAERYDCSLQIGGSDQWGNITAGIDLVRRVLRQEVHALTLPLITKSNGEKFGKSAGGETLWLDQRRTSPYQFYQFWMNTADQDLERMFHYFTLLNHKEIHQILAAHQDHEETRGAQRRLASEITQIAHQEAGLAAAVRITEALFGGGLDGLTADDLSQLALDGLPALALSDSSMSLSQAMREMKLIKNTNMFKDALSKGAVQVNSKSTDDFDAQFNAFSPLHQRYYLIRFGKRKWGLAYLAS